MNKKLLKNILLTGSSGFIGSNFKSTYKDSFNITSVSLKKMQPKQIELKNTDCVVHCAALVHQMQGAPESEYFKINYELTKDLANHAKSQGVKHFIFLSTAHVFGDSGDLYNHNFRLNENSPCNPTDAYGKSKLSAERYLLEIQSQDFNVSIIRPPMVYGKGAKGNIITLAKLINIIPILPLNYEQNRRSLIYIDNLCQFIALVIETQSAGILLPQDAEPVSIASLSKFISSALLKKRYFFIFPKHIMLIIFKILPKISVRLYGTLAFDSRETNLTLKYKPQISSQEGLKRMLF